MVCGFLEALREKESKRCFLVKVEDQSAATLIPLIKQYILPGRKIMSDCWKSYDKLEKEGYIHDTVNHSIEFVTSPQGNYRKYLGSNLPRSGTTNDHYNSYFAEFLFRCLYIEHSDNRLIACACAHVL